MRLCLIGFFFFPYMAKGNRLLNFLIEILSLLITLPLPEPLMKSSPRQEDAHLYLHYHPPSAWFVQEAAGKREYVGWARGQVVSIRRHSPQFQPHKGILRSSCDKSLFLWLFKRPTSRLKTSFPHCASLQATLSYLCWWRMAAWLRVPHPFYRALEEIERAWFWGSQCIWITWPNRLHVMKMRSHKAGVDSDGIWKGQGRVSLGLKEFQAQLQSW